MLFQDWDSYNVNISAKEYDCTKQDSALELNELVPEAVVMKVMNIHGVLLLRHVK